ncbi:hypothetical protein P732_14840 [Listeria monocytogenes SHL015]|nr:hypothetical protein P732_14840 [Listeria monocytogenes SHL015]
MVAFLGIYIMYKEKWVFFMDVGYWKVYMIALLVCIFGP